MKPVQPSLSFVGNAGFPDGGLTLAAGEDVAPPMQFRPSSSSQVSYQAQLSVSLQRALRPNLPPKAWLNLTKVVPLGLGTVKSYEGLADSAPLLGVPDGGL